MRDQRTAVYAGSFDPVTNGHVDVAARAARLFDRVIIGVTTNISKNPMFSAEERRQMVAEALAEYHNVEVAIFSGLLVDYARSLGAEVIIKGLRAVSDFEYEFQMALMNRNLAPEIETVFLATDADKAFLSSSLIKEVASMGGTVAGLVPPNVDRALKDRLTEVQTRNSGDNGHAGSNTQNEN